MIKLKGMTWDHDRGYQPLVAASEAYKKIHPDIQIEWEKRSLQAFADRPLDVLAEEYDLLIIDHPHVGEASAKGSILPLNRDANVERALLLKNSFVGPSLESYTLDSTLWALPIDAACQVACYRPDLLKQVPKTWNDVANLAKDKQVLWPLKPVDAIDSLFTLCANMGKPVASSAGVFFDKPTAVKALTLMQEISKTLPAFNFDQNPIEVLEVMSESDDFSYCPLLFGYTNYSRTGYRKNLVSFTDMPSFSGTVAGSIIGGTGIAVSALSKHSVEAIDFSFYVSSADFQSTDYVRRDGQPAHLSAWTGIESNEITNNFFGNTFETMNNSWLRPRYNGFLYLADYGGNVVNEFLKGKVSLDSVIEKLEILYQESLSGNKSYNFE